MSNRYFEIGRIPLIPDPLAALKAGAIVGDAIAQTKRVIQYKDGFFEPASRLWHAFGRYGEALDRATFMRDLSVMGDRELEIRGVRRDEIRDLFFRERVDEYFGQPTNNRAGDAGR